MKSVTKATLMLLFLAMLALPASAALQGRNGYVATLRFAPADIQGAAIYPAGFAGVPWSDLAQLDFWAPIGQGQRDAIAADAVGNVYVLVRGRDSNSGYDPEYTGLVRYDGTDFHQLTQEQMSSGFYASRVGTEIQSVVVAPTSVGDLTAGHPVLVRHVIIEDVGGTREYAAEVVSVDPGTGAETFLWSFDAEASQARVVIDGSGTSTDGVIYVGPLQDGRIATLTWNGSTYLKGYVPGSFRAANGLLVGPDGDLYTFESGETWSGATRDVKDIYRVDPGTGSASVHASVEGFTFPYDWEFDASGALWMGLVKSGRKPLRYVVQVTAGTTTSSGARICDSGVAPASLATGPSGAIYVLESPFSTTTGAVWELAPGSGGGGGKGGGKGK